MPDYNTHNSRPHDIFLLVTSVFLVSSSVIALQIVLQRFLSIVLTYHFVFLVISIALLGLSLGNLFAYLVHRFLYNHESIKNIYIIALAFYLILTIIIILSYWVNQSSNDPNNITIYSILWIVPFIISGMFIAKILYTFPEYSGQIYSADLIGASCGSVGIIFLLSIFKISYTFYIIVLVPLILLTAFYVFLNVRLTRSKIFIFTASILLFTLLSGLILLTIPQVSVKNNPKKEIYDALNQFNGNIIESKQSATGRVDLVKFPEHPELMDIYVDGTAGMPMYKFGGNFNNPESEITDLKVKFPGYFPLRVIDKDKKETALVIGSGGGRDILLSKMAGFNQITAVEVNSDIIEIAKDYSEFNGDIYRQDNVELFVQEGRNYLQLCQKNYDMIMFSLPVTNTSQGLGSYALTENYLYTSNAISEYINHLTSQGSLVIVTHHDLELLRLLSITLDAFHKKGVATNQAMKHLYVLGSNDYPVLVVNKNKIDSTESLSIYRKAMAMPWIKPGSSFFPHVDSPYLNQRLLSMENNESSLKELIHAVAEKGRDISPVTDQSPFFYKFQSGLPASLTSISCVSIIILAIFIIFPLIYMFVNYITGKLYIQNLQSYIWSVCGFSIYFMMLGIGFIIFEVIMIQKFMRILGTPIFSMTTVLFTLLLGGGLGSWFSSKLPTHELSKNITLASSTIILLAFFYIFSLTPIFENFTINSLTLRITLSICLLFPLGFALGFPLPLAIRLTKELNIESIIPWMLAINGASSVFGSSLAIIVAILYGYNHALSISILCYLTIIFLLFNFRKFLHLSY